MAIIKTLKSTVNDVEQSVYPKTVLEAVVDAKTNETLDAVLSEINTSITDLNEKIDNIEPGGGGEIPTDVQEQIDGKVSKSGDTMTGDLNVKGNVNVLRTADNTGDALLTVPVAGAIQGSSSQYLSDILPSTKSFIGSIYANRQWYNVISSRHRNGVGDGTKYGMVLYSSLSSDSDLRWGQQTNTDTWETTKTILDNSNYSTQIPSATQSAVGLMSAADKTKLDYLKITSSTDVGVDDYSANAIGYAKASLFNQDDGALYKQVYSDKWVHEIFGDYRTGQLAVRGKNNGTWQSWRTVLDSGNYSSYALPKTGGKITGGLTVTDGFYSIGEQTLLYQDYYCFNTTQGAGKTGYWKLCTINITGTYAGSVIEFDMTCRYGFGKLYVSFNGATDISAYKVSTFKQTGGLMQCYIVKTSGTSSGSVFDIYVQKEEAYGDLTVTHMKYPQHMRSKSTLTWSGAYVSSVPSGENQAELGNDGMVSGDLKEGSNSVSIKYVRSTIILCVDVTDTVGTYLITPRANSAGSFDIKELAITGTSISVSASGTTLTIVSQNSGRYTYIEIL